MTIEEELVQALNFLVTYEYDQESDQNIISAGPAD